MSFGWLGKFRQGAWKSFRHFILQERRDIGDRIGIINTELARVGEIIVAYSREEDADTGVFRVTEERIGFYVTRKSSLEKLVQAYIAQGGNPFDISHFFIPDRSLVGGYDEAGQVQAADQYPYGGLVYPVSVEYGDSLDEYGSYPGGYALIRKYPPLRMAGRQDVDDEAEPYRNYTHYARRWCEREIQEKRDELEHRIIKLCDLREQLLEERDELIVQAFGGISQAVGAGFNQIRYTESLRVPRIVDLIDSIFYATFEDGHPNFDEANTEELDPKHTLFPDLLPDEANTAI